MHALRLLPKRPQVVIYLWPVTEDLRKQGEAVEGQS